MNSPHYQCFLALEQDFEESIRYAEVDSSNDGVFSVAYLKMLVSACIEIEATLKQLCQRYSPGSNPRNIDGFRQIVMSAKSNYHLTEIELPRYGRKIQPWHEWGSNLNPDWWRAYNSAKHDRGNYYHLANQKNVILALSALFCNVIYLYADCSPRLDMSPEPRLFHFETLFPHQIVFGGALQLP